MNKTTGVIDTNTLILLERMDPAGLPDEPVITAITLAELPVGPLHRRRAGAGRPPGPPPGGRRGFGALPFDASAARIFGRVAAGFRRSGRSRRTAR